MSSRKLAKKYHYGGYRSLLFEKLLNDKIFDHLKWVTSVMYGFLIIAGLRPVTLLKKRLWHRCLSVNFAKFLKTLFL